jgi:hypothetical protein
MSTADSDSEIRVDIELAGDNGRVLMTISTGTVQYSYGISLSDARALSLALVRQASRAELRDRPKTDGKRKPGMPGDGMQPTGSVGVRIGTAM